jgi:hypothetical protein
MDGMTIVFLAALALMALALIYRALGGPTARRRSAAPLGDDPEKVAGSATPDPKDDAHVRRDPSR